MLIQQARVDRLSLHLRHPALTDELVILLRELRQTTDPAGLRAPGAMALLKRLKLPLQTPGDVRLDVRLHRRIDSTPMSCWPSWAPRA